MTRCLRFLIGVSGVSLACATSAGAQELPRLTPGAPVRLIVRTPAGPRPFTGGLVVLTYDSVTIARGLRPETFSLGSVERFAINRGRPAGVMIGAPVTGAALGALVGIHALGPGPACDVAPDEDDCRWETPPVVVGTAGGVVVLSVLAVLLVPEVWQEIPVAVLLGGRSSATGRPSGGIGIGFRFSYAGPGLGTLRLP